MSSLNVSYCYCIAVVRVLEGFLKVRHWYLFVAGKHSINPHRETLSHRLRSLSELVSIRILHVPLSEFPNHFKTVLVS